MTDNDTKEALLTGLKEALDTSGNDLSKNKNIILGLVNFLAGNYEKSTRLLSTAYELDSSENITLFLLVESLFKQGDLETALLITRQIDNDSEFTFANAFMKKYVQNIANNKGNKPKEMKKVLFVQDAPTARSVKIAAALKKAGNRVGLCYTKSDIKENYALFDDSIFDVIYNIKSYREIWKYAENYDLIHSFNFPDILTVASLASGMPVIHDTIELMSQRDGNSNHKYFEGIAIKGAHGRVFSSEYQLTKAKELYGEFGNSLVVNNYILKDQQPSKFLPKLSRKDNKTHFVFSGPLDTLNMKNKDFYLSFINLARHGIFVHIIPEKYIQESANFFAPYKNIFYNQPLSPDELKNKLTQYDFGLIPKFDVVDKSSFPLTSLSEKMFEYLSAGLPVAAPSLPVYKEFFQQDNLGLCYDSTQDLIKKISVLKEINRKRDVSEGIKTMEEEAENICNLYKKVVYAFY